MRATGKGSIGKVPLEHLEQPFFSIWLNDYNIEKDFKERYTDESEMVVFRINLSQGVVHRHKSEKSNSARPFDFNRSHYQKSDREARMASLGHFHSLDILFKVEIVESIIKQLPDLELPLLILFFIEREYAEISEEISPNKEIMQLVDQMIFFMQREEFYEQLSIAAEVLLVRIMFLKTSELQS